MMVYHHSMRSRMWLLL